MAEGAADSGGKADGPCSYRLMKGGGKEGQKGKRKRKWKKERKKTQKPINLESWQQHPIPVPMTQNRDFPKWFASFGGEDNFSS